MHKLEFEIIAKPGDRVMVLNTKKSPNQWEEGEIFSVHIDMYSSMSIDPSYRIKSDRSIFYIVSKNQIKLIDLNEVKDIEKAVCPECFEMVPKSEIETFGGICESCDESM